jgi:archaellum component FlaC
MDEELVRYLDQRFGQVDRRFTAIDQRFDQVDQRFVETDQRFTRIDQRFDEMNQRFAAMDQRFTGIDQRIDEVDQRFDEVKRHTGVLVEGLRHEIHLVAEGLAMHVQVQHAQEREYHDQQHRETRVLIRSVYDELRGPR